MAILIECDRCGETSDFPSPEIPKGWIRLPTVERNVSNPMGADGTFEGGEFCRGCAFELIKWRRPIPKAEPWAKPGLGSTKPY